MTALAPNTHATAGTAPIALPAPRKHRAEQDRTGLAPHWAQVAALLVTIVAGSVAALLVRGGAGWVAIPLAVLAVVVTLGAFLPDVLARRWDRDAEGAEGAL